MADVNGAPLPSSGRVGSPSLNPRKRTQQVCCTENMDVRRNVKEEEADAPTRAKSLNVILANDGYSRSIESKALAQCYTMLQELRFVIVGGALIHKNREGSKHKGRRIHPTISDFGGNCASNQSPFNNGRVEEWNEEKEDRVPTTKIFRSKILINNSACSLIIDGCSINNLVSRKLADFLKLPMEICPIKGYQVCRVPVTIGKSYKVEVLCIVDDIDEKIAMVPPKVTPQLPKPEVKVEEKIDMVPPKVTPQLPKPEVKVEDKIVKAEGVDKEHITRCFGSWIDHWKYSRRVKKYEGFRVDVKRKSTKDKVRREVLEVYETLAIENLRASSFQAKGIHVDETKVNAVRDWPSPKILPEVRNNKVADAFQEEDELEYVEPLDEEAKQVKYIIQQTLCSPKVSDSSQRNKIFQTKCLVKEKICSIIIDGRSCVGKYKSEGQSTAKLKVKVLPA
ncbi:hypothetical protein Tco_0877856 [Tanacetum coccineum]|uniref:Uncharacterized protein n=1 Tax=Tanacetum coccineum TaxID=301880 RepID=A0ABQ5BW87_9ASTR